MWHRTAPLSASILFCAALPCHALAQDEPGGPAVVAPGPCVPVPQVRQIIGVLSREAHPRPEQSAPEEQRRSAETVWHVDLDRDGQHDAFVPVFDHGYCTHEHRYDVYLMRGDCGHLVGQTHGLPELFTPATADALQPLIVRRRWAEITNPKRPPSYDNVATLIQAERVYRAIDGRYVASDEVTRRGTCHHCGMPRCRALAR